MNLIVTGCSFTNYRWPTWADYLATGYSKYYNLGRSGAGNRYIFHSLLYAIETGIITSLDTVIIQWSSLIREDRILPESRGWRHSGNIFNDLNPHPTFSKDFVNNYFTCYQSTLEFLGYIEASKTLLNNIGCNFKFISMLDYTIDNFLGEPTDTSVPKSQIKVLKEHNLLEKLEEKYKTNFLKPSIEEVNRPKKPTEDPHPTSLDHFRYTTNILLPELTDLTSTQKNLILQCGNNSLKWNSAIENNSSFENLDWPFKKRHIGECYSYKKGKDHFPDDNFLS